MEVESKEGNYYENITLKYEFDEAPCEADEQGLGDVDGDKFVSISVLLDEPNELAESHSPTEDILSAKKFTYSIKSIRRVDPEGNTPEVATTSLESEPVFNAFESAVDDWYAKLSVHRPLEDCEILESAQQLAIHFNVSYDINTEWVSGFKTRLEEKKRQASTLGNQTSLSGKRCGSPDLHGNKRHKEAEMDDNSDCEVVKEEDDIAEEEIELDSPFVSQLLDWQYSITAPHKLMVAATILEGKAVEVALSLGMTNFHPSKVWLKAFLGRYGLWCTLNGKRKLFFAPAGGMLKSRFDVEFEVWYHFFPSCPDYFMDYVREYSHMKGKYNKYLTEIFDWYTSRSVAPTADEITSAEAEIAAGVGLMDKDVEAIKDINVCWLQRHEKFIKGVAEAYTTMPVMFPMVLRTAAKRWATRLALEGFTPHQMWMRRYLLLHGLLYHDGNSVHCFMLDTNHCQADDFNRIFSVWSASSACNTEQLIKTLQEMLPDPLAGIQDEEGTLEDPVVVKDEPEEADNPLQIEHAFTLQT